jgi:branched-chain amino acid aminotransferase group I
MEELVYLNGKLLPSSQAWLSPFDHGFFYGYGLFETMRAYSGRVFRLARHLDRLRGSVTFMSLTEELAHYDLAKAVVDTLQANHLSDARIRLTLSAGPGDIVPDPDRCDEPTVFIVARTYTPLSARIYERGFQACLSSFRRDSLSPLSRLKSCSYLLSVLARREAKLAGVDEGLLINEKGELTEGSTSNLFIVSGDVVLTPPLGSGILPGITRETVLELASSLGLKALEMKLVPADLFQAEEAFLTNALLEIVPLTTVDRKPVGSGRPGSLTGKLMSAYKDLVRAETQSP